MATSNSAEAASTEPTKGLLVDHLARHEASALASLLGPSTMDLLSKFGTGATSREGLAYFFVSVHGDREVLRRSDIRSLLISKLDQAEATNLCQLLGLPAFSPHQTLAGINFDAPRKLELLYRWYGVEREQLEAPLQSSEGSQKAIASHKLREHQLNAFRELRRSISSPSAILVHMPFGAGKLRLVATAALDFFRSARDDKSVVWLAPGAAMCEEAFIELRDVWEQLGSRDITILQLYGSYPPRDLDRLGGSIAVIDILQIAKDDEALKELGANTSVAILADAENLVHPIGAEIVQKMLTGGNFPLVGILASSGAAIPPGSGRDALKAAFSGGCITVADEGELRTLQAAGDFVRISGSVVDLTGPELPNMTAASLPHVDHDNALDFAAAYVSNLDNRVQRNERLLDLLKAESMNGGRIVFFATTAASARLFGGLLPVLGIPATAITAQQSPAERTLAIQKFVARDEKVLCVHGFLLAGNLIPDVASCVMASPIKSKAAFLSTIGRLVQGRNTGLPALRLIVAVDSQADVGLVESLGTWSALDS